jgi:hypothetical protein
MLKRGRPARGIERIQVEERKNLTMELYIDGATNQQIADAVGYADRHSARKAVERLIAERGVEHRRRAWPVSDAAMQEILDTSMDLMRGAGTAENVKTAIQAQTSCDRHFGIAPDQFVEVHHSGDGKMTEADRIARRIGLDPVRRTGCFS